jgi:hypothetical protein
MTITFKHDKLSNTYAIFNGETQVGHAKRQGRIFELDVNAAGRELNLINGMIFERMKDSRAGKGLVSLLAEAVAEKGPKVRKGKKAPKPDAEGDDTIRERDGNSEPFMLEPAEQAA